MRDLEYLKLMSREYPSIRSASGEMINLMAIQGLPKGTEYFFSAFLLRDYPGEDQGDFWLHYPGRRADRIGQPDLLSGSEYPPYDGRGTKHRGLAEDYHLPSGKYLQRGFF